MRRIVSCPTRWTQADRKGQKRTPRWRPNGIGTYNRVVTIAVSIRTNTAAVFAADSKLTTSGLVGFDEAGEPQFVNQTYDNATKIVQDGSGTAMAVVAGSGTLGSMSVMDYVASSSVPRTADPEKQEALLLDFAQGMGKLRAAYWHDAKVSPDKWPVTALMMAVAPVNSRSPRVWHLLFAGEEPVVKEIKVSVYLEGSIDSAYSLLYGYRSEVMDALAREPKAGDQPVGEETVYKTLNSTGVLRPIDKISPRVMPIQDAIDLAVFLATTQVQMERFLPGEPVCGGPIDVMVLKTSPKQEILWLPGKEVRHPHSW